MLSIVYDRSGGCVRDVIVNLRFQCYVREQVMECEYRMNRSLQDSITGIFFRIRTSRDNWETSPLSLIAEIRSSPN